MSPYDILRNEEKVTNCSDIAKEEEKQQDLPTDI